MINQSAYDLCLLRIAAALTALSIESAIVSVDSAMYMLEKIGSEDTKPVLADLLNARAAVTIDDIKSWLRKALLKLITIAPHLIAD